MSASNKATFQFPTRRQNVINTFGITKFEYTLFTSFQINFYVMGKYKFIYKLITLFSIIQYVAFINRGLVYHHLLEENTNQNFLVTFFFSALTFKGTVETQQSLLIRLFIFDSVGLITVIFSFAIFVFLYIRLYRTSFWLRLAQMLSDISYALLIFPFTIFTADIIGLALDGDNNWSIALIVTTLIWLLLLICTFLRAIKENSIFMTNGQTFLSTAELTPVIPMMLTLFISQIIFNFIGLKITTIMTGVINLAFVYLILHPLFQNCFFNISARSNAVSFSCGFLSSGVIHIYVGAMNIKYKSLLFIVIILMIIIISKLVSHYALKKLSEHNARKLKDTVDYSKLKMDYNSFIRLFFDGCLAGLPCVFDGSFLGFGIEHIPFQQYNNNFLRLCAFLDPNAESVKKLEELSSAGGGSLYDKFALYEYRFIRCLCARQCPADLKESLDQLILRINQYPLIFDRFASASRSNPALFTRYASYLLGEYSSLEADMFYFARKYRNVPEVIAACGLYVAKLDFSDYARAYLDIAREASSAARPVYPLSALPLAVELPAAAMMGEDRPPGQRSAVVESIGLSLRDFRSSPPARPFPIHVFAGITLGVAIFVLSLLFVAKIQDTYDLYGALDEIVGAFSDLVAIIPTNLYSDISQYNHTVVPTAPADPPGGRAGERDHADRLWEMANLTKNTNMRILSLCQRHRVVQRCFSWYATEKFPVSCANMSIEWAFVPLNYLGIVLEVHTGNLIMFDRELYQLMANYSFDIIRYFDTGSRRFGSSIAKSTQIQVEDHRESSFLGCSILLAVIAVNIGAMIRYLYIARECRDYCAELAASPDNDITGVFLKIRHQSMPQVVAKGVVLLCLIFAAFITPIIVTHSSQHIDFGRSLRNATQALLRVTHLSGAFLAITVKKHIHSIPFVKDELLLRSFDALGEDFKHEIPTMGTSPCNLPTSFVSLVEDLMEMICENGTAVCPNDDTFSAILGKYQSHVSCEIAAQSEYFALLTNKMLGHMVLITIVIFFLLMVIIVMFISYIAIIQRIHELTRFCIAIRNYVTKNAVSTNSGGNALDVMNRPAALLIDGRIFYPNLELLRRCQSSIEELTGSALPDEGDFEKIEMGGGKVLAFSSASNEKLIERKIAKLSAGIESLNTGIDPFAKSFVGLYVGHVEIALRFGWAEREMDYAEKNRLFIDNVCEIDSKVSDILRKYNGVRVNWCIRSYSLLFPAATQEEAALKALSAASEMILYASTNRWKSSRLIAYSMILSYFIDGSFERIRNYIPALTDRYGFEEALLILDSGSYNAIRKITGELPLIRQNDTYALIPEDNIAYA